MGPGELLNSGEGTLRDLLRMSGNPLEDKIELLKVGEESLRDLGNPLGLKGNSYRT